MKFLEETENDVEVNDITRIWPEILLAPFLQNLEQDQAIDEYK